MFVDQRTNHWSVALLCTYWAGKQYYQDVCWKSC